MTKREIAESMQGILDEIMSVVQAALYDDIDDDSADDAISGTDCAADDIGVLLGELRALLKEVEQC